MRQICLVAGTRWLGGHGPAVIRISAPIAGMEQTMIGLRAPGLGWRKRGSCADSVPKGRGGELCRGRTASPATRIGDN